MRHPIWQKGYNMSNEDLVEQIRCGNDTTGSLEKLYMNNKRYIFKIANRYKAYADIEDLMQEAYFGLYEAVQHYECSHEVLFMTYAAYWIRQSITRYIYNNGNCIKITVGLNTKIYQYKKVVNAYESQLNRNPTEKEICRHLKIDSKALKRLEQTIQEVSTIDSLDRQTSSEDDSLILGDLIKDNVNIENDVIDQIMKDKIKIELWEIVKANATERENEVIVGRFKRNMTLEALGSEQQISKEMVRTIESRTLRKLRLPRIRRDLEDRFEINYVRSYRGSVGQFNHTWTSSTEYAALKNLEIKQIM